MCSSDLAAQKIMRERTDLEERLERDEFNTRIESFKKEIEAEIRRRLVADRGVEAMAKTLRKPLPALEPLGPIVHKPARAGVSRIVVSPKPKLSREANDAFAADWPQPQRTATSSYDAYDRNRPQ